MKLTFLPFDCPYCGAQLVDEGRLITKKNGNTQVALLYAYCPNEKCKEKGVEKKFRLIVKARLFEI